MGRLVLGALALLCFTELCTASLYTASSPVVSLDSDNFRAKMKNNQMALVKFYAPWCGHCTALQPDFEKVAKAMKGAMMVAAIDADAHKDLGQEFGIKGFPSIKFLYMEGDKVKSVDYQGQRTAKDIIPWAFEKAKNLAMKRIGEKSSGGGAKAGSPPKGAAPPKGGAGEDDGFYKGTDVVTLSDSNFSEEVTGSNDLWLVEFYAPWCGHCKNLKPNWIEAATELKGKVKLGAMDCTIHKTVCAEYGVQGYPTIKFFGQSKSSPEDYQGPREAQGIVSWAKEKWSRVAPPPEVLELTDNNAWEKTCVGEKGKGGAALCILAFLPDILDAKAVGRNRHIKLLKKVAEKFKDQPYAYLWAQGGAQAGLEANLGVGGFGYPALVALNPKKKFFTLARGAFEEKHVIDFLEGLKLNRYPVQSVQGDLAAINSNAPWDGKDAAVQLEDEFSLDDLE